MDRRRRTREQSRQFRLALDQRLRGDVRAIGHQQVEGVEVQIGGFPTLQLRLQDREAGIAGRVGCDDLPVDQRGRQVEIRQGRSDGREPVAPVQARAGEQLHRSAGHRRQAAIAVIFDLVQPPRPPGHRIDQRRQLRLDEAGQGAGLALAVPPGLGGRRGWRPRRRRRRSLALGDLAHGAPGRDAGHMPSDQIVAAARMAVVDLAQQPVLARLAAARFQADQDPLPLHPFAVEREMQMPLVDVRRTLARNRCPGSAIPQHHRAAAIFASRNGALERRIGHRMVLGAHREALVLGVHARPARHRPAFEHAVHLDTEIEMQPRRVMLLHDE